MKAAICRQFATPLSFEDVTIAPASGHAVKIKVQASAICHSDITYLQGGWGGNLPILCGHEAAGTVIETGRDVSQFKAGDRVVITLMRSCGACSFCGDNLEAICDAPPAIKSTITTDTDEIINPVMNSGTFAEEVLVHERQIIAIPDSLDFAEACLLGCGVITGFGSVTRVAKVQADETLAVIGAGGIGINAVQSARLAGASTIIAIDTSAHKEAFIRELGATHFINPSETNSLDAVMEITQGRGLDYVFVGVGASKAVESAIPLLRKGGKMIMMGMPRSDDLASIDMADLAEAAKTIIGTKMGSSMIRQDIPKLIQYHQKGQIELKKLISHYFDFSDINAAIDMAMTPQSARVVVIF